MKRAVMIIGIFLLASIPLLNLGCSNTPDVPNLTPEVKALQGDVSSIKSTLETKTTKDYVDGKIANIPQPQNTGYTRAEVDAKIADLQSKIDAANAKITQWTTGNLQNPNQQPQQNTNAPTGIVSVSVLYPSPGTPISTTNVAGSALISTKVYNNMAQSRWVSLSLSLVPYLGTNNITNFAGTLTGQSSSFSSTPLSYQTTPVGSPINRVLFTPSGGGINTAGELLIASGTAIDITFNLAGLTSTPNGLWTVTISSSDRATQ